MSSSATPAPVIRERVIEATGKEATLVEAVFSRRHRQLLFGGGIRGGKTWGALLTLFLLCRVFPGSRWAIVRKDLPTLKRNVYPSFNKLRPAGFCRRLMGDTHTATCANGSQIIMFPESRDVDPELERWRGLEVNGFVLDEGNELAERSFNKAIERAGSWILPDAEVQPPAFVLTTCNPSPGWVKRLFYDPWKAGSLPAHRRFIPATAADNPHIPDAVRLGWTDLPERDYNRFIKGEWDDLVGAALDELDEDRHLVPVFAIPSHWPVWAAFDWGFGHCAVWMWFTADEDGTVYLVDTYRARRLRDDQLAQGIIEQAPQGFVGRLGVCEAGHDAWTNHEHKGSRTPDTAEVFGEFGLSMRRANVARVQGLNNLRQWIAWRPAAAGQPERTPRLKILRTKPNLRVFDRLKEILLDPDRPNDALKVDADPETGEGGDDDYDCLRYGLANRPVPARLAPLPPTLGAWSPEVLQWEAERNALGLPLEPDPPPNAARKLTRNPRRRT